MVLLDTLADRYRLLTGPAATAIQSLAEGDAVEGGVVAERLRDLGILVQGSHRQDVASVPPPTCSALEMAGSHVRPPARFVVAHHVLRATSDLRFRGLARTLRSIDADGSNSASQPLVGVAQAYASARRHIPLTWVCLRDSIALHRFLSARGLATRLVIGVRLDPFAAHCWLQNADMIVNDICDNVAGYKPILVL
ncbi:lasso peptide biosynthesis B2 protein [Sphingomonas oryzagri]